MKKCAICGSEEQVFYKTCFRCAHKVFESVADFLDKSDQTIKEQFNIIEIPEHPLTECNCKHDSVLVFDYYTMQEGEDSFRVILCAVCRGCGGYRDIATNITSPFKFKDTPYRSIKTDEIEEEQVDYYV